MAPYVLTPTTEREHGLGDYETHGPVNVITEPSEASSSSHGPEVEVSNGAEVAHGETHSVSHPEVSVTSNGHGGYTEGYAKSHTELKHQPIAIVGMSCRFPGNVSTPDEFWELCARARTGFSEIPKDRFESERFFHPNPGKSGTTNARGGNFLQQDLTAFDAPFFSFTAQEATSLDPQQRLLLECTFEALEGAGMPKHSVVGKDVGCFVGGTFSEYEADLFRDPDTIPMHQATAAGVHLNMMPEFWISYSMSRLFGEAGRSFAFDQRGTGYGRGEGCGLVILKPLDQAIKDNDPIRAVITGSGINQDGKTPEAAAGIAGIIKTALMLERGFVLPNYDFKQPNEKIPFDEWGLKVPTTQRPWPIGKRWASINGFGFGGTNSHVVMTKGPLERKTMNAEIDTHATQRLFVLSANDKISTEKVMQSLGIYLEQRPEVFQNDLLSNLAYTLGQRKSLLPWRAAIVASNSVELVEALSNGKTFPAKQEPEALRIGFIFTGQGAQWWAMGRELYERYPIYAGALDKADAHLRSIGAPFSLLEELSKDERTTQINAAHMSQPSCTAIQLALTELLRSWGIRPSAVSGHSSGEIGAAYAAGFINFEDAMTIAYHRGRLIPILKEKFPDLDGCMMAVGAGKTEISPLLERIPDSMGEARIACINSPSSVTVSGDGKAIIELQRIIEEVHPGMFARKLQIDTAYHSHHMNLVAKDYTQSLLELQKPTSSDVRFHSSLLGRLAESFELDATYWVQNLVCAVKFDEAVQSMCEPVGEFKTGVNFLIELGPHSALQGPIKQTLKVMGGQAPKIGYSSVLSRKKDAVQTAFSLAGALFIKGAMLDFGAINFPKPSSRLPAVLTDMPRYPWNHQTKYYHQSRFTDIHKFHKERRSDIIGVLASYSNDLEPTWRNIIRLDELPWLRHHQIQSLTIFPISGFIAMALEAAAQRASSRDISYDVLEVSNINVATPVMIPDDDLELTITLRPHNDGHNSSSGLCEEFYIRSWSKSKGWTEHCKGSVSTKTTVLNEVDGERTKHSKRQKLASKIFAINKSNPTPVNAASLYTSLSDIGVSYGPTFQGLHDCRASDIGSTAQISLADTSAEMPNNYETEYIVHPTFIEQLIELYWPILGAHGSSDTVYLPSSIGKVSVSSKIIRSLKIPGSKLQAYCQPTSPIQSLKPNTLSLFAVPSPDSEEILISIDDLVIAPILERAVDAKADEHRELCYKLTWEPAMSHTDVNDAKPASQFNTDIVIVHGETDLQQNLAASLAKDLSIMTGQSPITSTLSKVDAKDKICLFLVEIDTPFLANLDSTTFEALQQLLTSVQSILWVVRGAYTNSKHPDSNMIAGLSRTLRSEGTLMDFITLDLDAEVQLSEESTNKVIIDVLSASLAAERLSEETEYMERSGSLLNPRIINDHEMNEYVHQQIEPSATELASFTSIERPLRGFVTTPGALDSVQFDNDTTLETPLPEDNVEIRVKAIGLDARDLEAALGHLPTSDSLGMECSGVVTSIGSKVSNVVIGDRVAAVAMNGSLSTVARAHDRFLFKLPNHMSFREAATIPVAYSTAYYGLVELASLSEGEFTLIHDGATAVGQAAIAIAQTIGAEVHTTVHNAEQKKTLQEEYNISDDRIHYIGNDEFASAIQETTNGSGVHVILNSVSSADLLCATWASLSDFGRFVNIGTKNIGTIPVEKNPSVTSLDIRAISKLRPAHLERTLSNISRFLKYGKIRSAHPLKTYGISEVSAALHALQTDHVHGKLVIEPRDDELVLAPRVQSDVKLLQKEATYILIGGTGGLGRSMASWMIGKGAKNIVLLSRSGSLKGKAKDQIDELNNAGANIVVRRCDVADKSDVENLISSGLTDLPPVRGVIHGAMVLNDVLFEKMNYEQYSTVIESKVKGAWNFHHALKNNPLDFFIVISSAAGAVGNRGQAAYAAANTFLNGFTQYRVSNGLPASSIDLTAVSDAGYLAEDLEKAAEVARNLGSDTICEAEVLALISAAISGKMANTCNHHSITGMRITATMRPFWSQDAKFVHLLKVAEEAAKELSSGKAVTISWSAAFKAVTTREEAEEVVCNALVEKIAEVISMEKEELDTTRALSHYPLDSLTAIEVRNFITRMFEANLQVLELLASGSIQTLAKMVCTKSKLAVPAA
ncbi:hypothetical protein B0J11DRAFT_592976 [Dendryphion nanum]|uniref:Polyketide synthase n=1 Tax=Dendryphion nanum TaxID=256645 RepID=A0A9P9DCN9_9PLEO|nr:hypothetical protein B0J11DRAFT_592976 [Dendryphion nanum]